MTSLMESREDTHADESGEAKASLPVKFSSALVIGPDGFPLTRENLPPPDLSRWVARRKAEIVAAVTGGLLTMQEACSRYNLSVDEFLSWKAAFAQYGLRGLAATRRTPAVDITV